MLYIFFWNLSKPCVISGYMKCFHQKGRKNISKDFSRTNAISITSGIFHLTLNYKPDFAHKIAAQAINT